MYNFSFDTTVLFLSKLYTIRINSYLVEYNKQIHGYEISYHFMEDNWDFTQIRAQEISQNMKSFLT